MSTIKKWSWQRQYQRICRKTVAKELRNYESKLEREQKLFQQKQIGGYKRSVQSKTLKKEDEIWDEVVGEGIE